MASAAETLWVVHDPRYGSLVRPRDGRTRPGDPRWEQARFLERLEAEIPLGLVVSPANPPPGARAVWFALPDPQSPDIVKHYAHWRNVAKPVYVINHPELTYRPKELWYWFLRAHGIPAPAVSYESRFRKTQFHGFGPEFGVEFISSRPHDPAQTTYRVWRVVCFDGRAGERSAWFEGEAYWVQSGCSTVRELRPTPPEVRALVERVAEVSGLGYFHAEVIPSPWTGPVICDVNSHPFDVLEGQLNDVILEGTIETVRRWLCPA